MAEASSLLKSDGVTVIAANLSGKTNRRIVELGQGTVVSFIMPGGFDMVKLNNATLDAQYLAATPSAPILLGVDNILFRGLLFPQASTPL